MAEYVLRINGRTHRVEGEPADSLLSVLRDDLGLTGSKFGCGEGYCGACTVLIDDQTTRSCVARLGAAAGKAITTIEGLSEGDRLRTRTRGLSRSRAVPVRLLHAGDGDGHDGTAQRTRQSVGPGHRATYGSKRLSLRRVSAAGFGRSRLAAAKLRTVGSMSARKPER